MMKKILLIALLAVTAAMLSAQSGLFGISYDDDLNTADSLMSQQGFVAGEVEGNMVKYYSDYNKLVDSVVLFVDPSAEAVAGWFVMYSKENTKEQDDYVITRLHDLHGEGVQYNAEHEQFIWPLTDTRMVQLQYVGSGNLCVLYYDSAYPTIFELPLSSQRKNTSQ